MIQALPFGRTGHESTRAVFGAASLWSVSQAEADRVLDLLLSYGVNHIDTAANYGDAELRLGPWMKQYRGEFFLATKTIERTAEKAREDLYRSLERLQANQIDLWQLHHLVDPQEWEIAMGPGGALEAALEAQRKGLIRFIGVTGHGLTVPSMHLRSLERFPFDSVLLPYNYPLMQNLQYAADFNALLAVCGQRQVAVMTIKSMVRSPWGEHEKTRGSWYRPFEDPSAVDKAIHWVLGQPGIFFSSIADVSLLPLVLDAASRFNHRPTEAEMQDLSKEQEMAPLF